MYSMPANKRSDKRKHRKNGVGDYNQVIDSRTQSPVSQADVSLPSKGYKTKTDNEGRFSLGAKIDAPTIMSVQKDGYKPFSLTVDGQSLSKSHCCWY